MERLRNSKTKILEELRKSFQEKHTPKETALSFAFGVFITALPTLGAGLIVFGIVSKLSENVNKIALFSSVLVLNPFIKPLFYISSIPLGAILISGNLHVSLEPEKILIYLITGSLIIALLISVIAYILVLKTVSKYQKPVEILSEDITEIIEEELENN